MEVGTMSRGALQAGNGAAKLLLRLRVILAGEGIVREGNGVFRAGLPRSGVVVEIDDRSGLARVTDRNDSGGGRSVDLRDGSAFVGLMGGVDMRLSGTGPLPVPVLRLADAYAEAMAGGDALLSSLVSEGNLELGRGEGPWAPPPTLFALAEAGRRSGDRALREASEAVLADPGSAEPYPVAEAQAAWCERVERWAGEHGEDVPAAGGAWRRLVTRVGVGQAAASIGLRLSDVLVHPEGGGRVSLEAAEAWAWRNHDGRVRAMATVADGAVATHGPCGGDAEVVDALVRHLGHSPRGMDPR